MNKNNFSLLEKSIEDGDIKTFISQLKITDYSFKNIEPFIFLAKNSTLEIKEYENIINEIKKRPEYSNMDLNKILSLVDQQGRGVLNFSIDNSNLYFINLFYKNNIDLSQYNPNHFLHSLKNLKTSSIYKLYGSNLYQKREECLKILDKIKIPNYNKNQALDNLNIFSFSEINHNKLLGFKFYIEIFRKTKQFKKFNEVISKSINHNDFYNTHKHNFIFNILSKLKKEDLNFFNIDNLLPLYILYNDKDKIFNNQKIKYIIQNDPNFFKKYTKFLLTKKLNNNQNSIIIYKNLDNFFKPLKNINIDDDFLHFLSYNSGFVFLNFLFNNGGKIDYNKVNEDHKNWSMIDEIFYFKESIFLCDQNYKLTQDYTNINNIIENSYNISTSSLARACIGLDINKQTVLFHSTFKNSLLMKYIKANDLTNFNLQINEYFKSLLNFSTDSFFEDYDYNTNDFPKLFISSTLFFKDILQQYSSKEFIDIFLSNILKTLQHEDFKIHKNEDILLFISHIEKVVINNNILDIKEKKHLRNNKRL